ncbi:MAG: CoA transferase [Dehalococcoidales bacterium]|nr:CoA transferase [Dehalococcoidales bacterium]
MAQNEKQDAMLSPYRVLDLTDEKGLLCGKILGDMGADVIKIEKPGGDTARNIGPFYHDEPDNEKSLFWFSLNTSKRGITLDIETVDGQEILKRLIKTTDFIIESFPPGYLDNMGMGYEEMENLKPGIIMVSITPFGQYGPYKDYKSSDIVAWAMSGEMSMWGDTDRPPVRISNAPQSCYNAGADAAIGALLALFERGNSGEGQHIDVSMQESLGLLDGDNRNPLWRHMGTAPKRGATGMPNAKHTATRLFPCKDGWVSWSHMGTSVLGPSLPLIRWMREEGMSNEFLENFDWTRPDFMAVPQEEMDKIDEPTARFFMTKTKAELLEGAVSRGVMMYPVATTADMLEDAQLIARKFWVDVEHPELGATIRYPGAFGHFSETPPVIRRRAPLIGEHNLEIFQDELGISGEELTILKQTGVI